MARPVTIRSVKSISGWASKSDQLALAFAPFATRAVPAVPAGQGSRIAVAANLCDVMGLEAFAQPPQDAANLELDDALLLPFV